MAVSSMFSGGGHILEPETFHPAILYQPQQSRRRPHVEIVEQPAPRGIRFRYGCEGRSENITGASSTSDAKTLPAIRVVGYEGKAKVVVSCVTKEHPYRPHPHKLVGRDCNKGLCVLINVPVDGIRPITFANLGILKEKRNNVETSLKTRQENKVDPFKTGFSHASQPSSINLNAIRLCFQVFIEDKVTGNSAVPLAPVVSEPIFCRQAVPDLVIVEMCSCVTYVNGENNKIILICKKVDKNDIHIRFFEEKDGQVVWEGFGEFRSSEVYNRTAISFRPPRYQNLDVTEPVNVFIQLVRPSDGETSEALPFQFLPRRTDSSRKRKKLDLNFIQDLIDNNKPDNIVQNVWPSPSPEVVPLQNVPSMNIPQPWNITLPSNLTHPDFGQLMAEDNNIELPSINIASGELETGSGNLSETFRQNLSLSDIDGNALDRMVQMFDNV